MRLFSRTFVSNFYVRIYKRVSRHKSRAEAWIVLTRLPRWQSSKLLSVSKRASERASDSRESPKRRARTRSQRWTTESTRGHKRGCRTDQRKRKRRTGAESEERRELVIAYYFWARKETNEGTRGGFCFMISGRHYYGSRDGVVVSPILFPLSRWNLWAFPKWFHWRKNKTGDRWSKIEWNAYVKRDSLKYRYRGTSLISARNFDSIWEILLNFWTC